MVGGYKLPELDIDNRGDLQSSNTTSGKKAHADQVRNLLRKFSCAALAADDNSAAIEQVKTAAFQMVGFGPMEATLQGHV